MKSNLLCLCDSPTVHTGFGNVSRNLLKRWKPHFDQIHIWGINYNGWPHDLPYRIYPAGNHDWNSAGKLAQFLNLLGSKNIRFQQVWILCDCHNLSGGNVPKFLRQIADAAGAAVTFYYPVDAPLERQWLDCVEVCDRAVTYTEYGRSETLKVHPKLDPLVIGHGVDPDIYRPLPQRAALRRKWFRWVKDDEFLMLNVNRNERRKAPHHSLLILKHLRALGVNAKLALHCPDKALHEGTSLEWVGRQIGLPHGEHWRHHEEHFFNYNGLLSEPEMNELYNAADLVLSTSRGEGWGLCAHPETPVRTPSGYKNISDLERGDWVLTSNGFRAVMGKQSRPYSGKLVEITADKRPANFPLKLTPDHPVLTESGFKAANSLTKSDRLVVARDGFDPYHVDIKSKSKSDYEGEVVDIEVEGCHDFMTHHCVIHNSISEGTSAGCLIAAPDHTSCGEIMRKAEALGQTGQMHLLPLASQPEVNMMDTSRVRYAVDCAKAAEVIAPLAAQRGRFTLCAPVKDWLSWDRLADEFLKNMP